MQYIPRLGKTLLYWAMYNKNVSLVVYLKNYGVKEQVQDVYGITPQLLLKNGDYYAVLYQMFDQVSQTSGSEFEKWVKQSFFSQANKTICLKTRNTLLHKAVALQNVPLITYLKNYEIKDRVQNFEGTAPEDLVRFDLLYKIFDQARFNLQSPGKLWARRRFFWRYAFT